MMLLLAAIIMGIFGACLFSYWLRRKKETDRMEGMRVSRDSFDRPAPFLFDRPSRWLAIKTNDIAKVQHALGLHHPTPCSVSDGLGHPADRHFFVSAPSPGW